MSGLAEETQGSGRHPAWTIDAGLGIAVAVVVSFVISANYGGRQDPDAIAYLWAVGLGSLMLVRRRYPLLVVAISVLGLFAYYAAGYPAVGVAVPIAAALFSAAEFGRMLWGAGAAVIALAASVFFRLSEGQDFSYVVGYELAGHAFLMFGALALGDSTRSRRKLVARSREVAALTADRARAESESEAQRERLAIARDLHDSIGHGISVISLHTDVAREAIEARRDAPSLHALRLVSDSARSTMADLRHTVALLRSQSTSTSDTAGLASVDRLIPTDSAVAFNLAIRLPDNLPSRIDMAAYRIVREAVTNIIRHSPAERAWIETTYDTDEFVVSIGDDGTEADGGITEGNGIRGMRERAESGGGTVETRASGDGFWVRASFPLGDAQ